VIPSDPADPLTQLWMRLAAHLPAAAVAQLQDEVYPDPAGVAEWEQERFSIWGEVADSQFDLLAAEDRRRRQWIAQRLAGRLGPAAQLFGRDHREASRAGQDVPEP
jgi:hypothetical protein